MTAPRCLPLLLLLFCLSCSGNHKRGDNSVAGDLPDLLAKGEITAVTLYSSTSFFQYKMDSMGYEYDMVKDFAQQQGLQLQLKVANNPTELIEMLQSGAADIAAYPIQVNNIGEQKLLFCGHENLSMQVLVQKAERGDTLLTDVTQLIGKEVYVQPDTRFSERLHHLNNELGGGILIREVPRDSLTVEDLIEMVSRGEIDYTVSDDNIARLNKTYFWNIDISLPVSFLQRSSWAVRKENPLLAAAINSWADDKAGIRTFQSASKRYFEYSKLPADTLLQVIGNGNISAYDLLFKQNATVLGWDWQLLAAISYQESRFNPNVTSWAGAEGLMGIMPGTARALGVSPLELKDPNTGIRTAIEVLRRFRQGFSSVNDPEEVMKFTLASYNAGIGHIYDAMRLARKYGKNPHVWDNHVAEFVRLKSDPEYYNDPVCKHGYLRGTETYKYVDEVIRRYRYYLEKTAT